MIIIGIENGVVTTIFDWAQKIEDVKERPTGLIVATAPDHVVPGWISIDNQYLAPIQSGWEFDYTNLQYYSHEEYRKILHSRTDPDVLEAQRKIREGDTSYDWQGWLNKLDAYNKAVSDTKNQPTYPDKVDYPEYPSR